MSNIIFYLIVILLFIAFLVAQIILSIKSSKRILKFIPLIVSVVITILLFVLGMISKDTWTGAGLWIFGVFSIVNIAACGLGFLVVFLIKKLRKYDY